MKTYDKEYIEAFERFTEIKDMLDSKVDMRSEEISDWYYENFVIRFNTLYEWTDRDFTILNADDEDIESLIDDMRDNKCETFAEFALMFMGEYVLKLQTLINSKLTKEE